MFRLIYYALIFYLIFRLVKFLIAKFIRAFEKDEGGNLHSTAPKGKFRENIREEDIVEVEFEEIPEDKEKSEGEKEAQE